MSEVIDSFVIRDALLSAGISSSVPAMDTWGGDSGQWIAVVNLFDVDFNDEAAVRASFETIGLRVEWIQHDLYSRFNDTAGGVDLGGGKTWNVIFEMATSPLTEDRATAQTEAQA